MFDSDLLYIFLLFLVYIAFIVFLIINISQAIHSLFGFDTGKVIDIISGLFGLFYILKKV